MRKRYYINIIKFYSELFILFIFILSFDSNKYLINKSNIIILSQIEYDFNKIIVQVKKYYLYKNLKNGYNITNKY